MEMENRNLGRYRRMLGTERLNVGGNVVESELKGEAIKHQVEL